MNCDQNIQFTVSNWVKKIPRIGIDPMNSNNITAYERVCFSMVTQLIILFFWFCRLLFCVRSVSLVNVFGLYILNGCSLRWTTMPNMWYHALWLGKINKERFLHKWNRYSIKCLLLLIESKLLCSSRHTNVFCENKNLRTKVVTVVFETELKMVCPCFSRSIFGENCSQANEFKYLCQPIYWYTKFQFTLSESQWLLEVDGKNTKTTKIMKFANVCFCLNQSSFVPRVNDIRYARNRMHSLIKFTFYLFPYKHCLD